MARVGSTLSVVDFAHLGSSFSLRSFARVGRALSVFSFSNIGSSLSLRSLGRLGSSFSVYQFARFGSTLAVLDLVHGGSSLSIRGFARFGSSLSIFGMFRMASSLSVVDCTHLGSSMSLRAMSRLGSSFSVFGISRLGSSISVLDYAVMCSSMSLRGFCRLGCSLSLFHMARFASRVSIFDFVSLGSSLSVKQIKTQRIGDGNEEPNGFLKTGSSTMIEFTQSPSPMMDHYVNSVHTMSMSETVSVLHGVWESDFSITTSDRRLKTSIQPLYQTIAARAKTRWSETHGDLPMNVATPDDGRLRGVSSSSSQVAPSKQQQDQPIGWLLRELRPVSFKLKSGPEAKYLKFGFIAQELETIFPNLVRNIGGGKESDEGTKAIASQDLIAVLTLALQSLQKEMEKQRDWMMQEIQEQRRLLDSLLLEQRMRMEKLERAVFATQI